MEAHDGFGVYYSYHYLERDFYRLTAVHFPDMRTNMVCKLEIISQRQKHVALNALLNNPSRGRREQYSEQHNLLSLAETCQISQLRKKPTRMGSLVTIEQQLFLTLIVEKFAKQTFFSLVC